VTAPGAEPLHTAEVARRDLVLAGLTIVSASADAISYLGLGRVFPANMTGNTVLLGIGSATGRLAAAGRSATALALFVIGAAVVGAVVPRQLDRRAFRWVLAAEAAILAVWSCWWLAAGVAAPHGATRYGLVALAGAAMGAQSGVVRHLDVPVSTTYITGTWTALSAGVAQRLGRRSSAARSQTPAEQDVPGDRRLALWALVVSAYGATAYAAGLAYHHLGATASVIPLATSVLVLVAATVTRMPFARRRRRH
jgi:uncharacterized membrane protein YoaK (UPF0700 family)